MNSGRFAGERARYLLFRVDDRLLHGQVALGWGRHLHPQAFLLADARLADDAATAAIFELTAPEGTRVVAATVEDVVAGRPDLPDPPETFLLVRDLESAARLLRSGVPGPLNLGGVNRKAGAREHLPYLYLTEAERRLVLELLEEGHELVAQDLPERPARSLSSLVSEERPNR